MKSKTIILLLLLIFIQFSIKAQITNDLIDKINLDSLVKTVRILSGEDSVFIGGLKTRIKDRRSEIGTNQAADYIKERFAELDLNVIDQKYSETGRNIYAIQEGSAVPDSFYIICAHFDSVKDFCADDNASGTSAVLEAARLLSDSCLRYSIIYALWDEEEYGLVGSFYFASQLEALSYKIKGVINLDMIGYDSNDDRKMELHVNNDPKTTNIKNALIQVIDDFKLKLIPNIQNPGTNGSDHTPFWFKGIGAVLIIEAYYSGDFNAFYHTANDRIDKFNLPYFHEMSKLGIVTFARLAQFCSSIPSGINEPENDFFVYPNPTNGKVEFNVSTNDKHRICVFDMFGKIVYDKLVDGENQVDLSNHSNGIYIIIMMGNGGVKTGKVLKVN